LASISIHILNDFFDLVSSIDQNLAKFVIAVLADRSVNGRGLYFVPEHKHGPGLLTKVASPTLGFCLTIRADLYDMLHGLRSPEHFDFEPHNTPLELVVEIQQD